MTSEAVRYSPHPRTSRQQAWEAHIRRWIRELTPGLIYEWQGRIRHILQIWIVNSILTEQATEKLPYFVVRCRQLQARQEVIRQSSGVDCPYRTGVLQSPLPDLFQRMIVMPQIQSVAPELPSLDLARTRQFYELKLGFRTVSQYDDYIIFERDNVWINYWHCHDPELPRSASCYIYVDDAKLLYEELRQHQIIHPHGTLQDRPYGVREFSVLDDNGCLLKFGQRLR